MVLTHVLIIDDHQDSADMLSAVLRLRVPGVTTQAGYDGRVAVTLARTRRPDAVILDLDMPGLGGAAAAAALRKEFPARTPMLIALSGNVAEIFDFKRDGLFDYAMTKPVDVARLLEFLASAHRIARGRPSLSDQAK